MTAASAELGFATIEECARSLLNARLSPAQLNALATHLTVGETYFFRDAELFQALETEVLPELIRRRQGKEQTIRIWSAACSSGEEPYSVAILLHKLLPRRSDWKITLLASDVNPSALEKAMHASYGAWSFRDTPAWVRNDYFHCVENGYVLRDDVRSMVEFFQMNLAACRYRDIEPQLTELDLVFCRNVLMYFSRAQAMQVFEKLAECCAPEAWIVTNPLEATPALRERFAVASPFTPALHRKEALPLMQPVGIVTPEPDAERGKRETKETSIAELPEMPDEQEMAGSFETAHGVVRRLANEGRLSEALERCTAALADDKLNPALHYLAAMILLELGDNDAAVDALKRVIYINAEDVLAHFTLGCLYRQQELAPDAQRCFAQVRRLLAGHEPNESLSDAEGINVAGLLEIIQEIADDANGR